MTCADAISFQVLASGAIAVLLAVAGPVGTYAVLRGYLRGQR